MKKAIIALALASVLCLGGLSACGGSSSTANNTNTNTTNTTATTTNTNTNANANNTAKNTTNTNSAANTNTNANNGVDVSAITSELEANLSTCYMGIGENEVDTYYLGFSADGSWGTVIVLDTDTGAYASWVGDVTSNGGGSYTVADDTNQTTLTFTAEEQTDGTWVLDCGDTLGKAVVASCTASDLVSAMVIIDAEGTPIM